MGESAKEAFVALVVNFPWLLDAIQWLSVSTNIWHSIESLVVLGGLWLVHRRLKGVSKQLHQDGQKMESLVTDLNRNLVDLDEKVDERVDTVTQLVNAARAAAETIQVTNAAQVSTIGSVAHWEQLRALWQEMRERIELKIRGIRNKNVRGKYGNIDRYSYRDVIVVLCDDKEISSATESALLELNRRFMSSKTRPNQVTAAQVNEFESLIAKVNGALPKLVRSKPDVELPLPDAAE